MEPIRLQYMPFMLGFESSLSIQADGFQIALLKFALLDSGPQAPAGVEGQHAPSAARRRARKEQKRRLCRPCTHHFTWNLTAAPFKRKLSSRTPLSGSMLVGGRVINRRFVASGLRGLGWDEGGTASIACHHPFSLRGASCTCVCCQLQERLNLPVTILMF